MRTRQRSHRLPTVATRSVKGPPDQLPEQRLERRPLRRLRRRAREHDAEVLGADVLLTDGRAGQRDRRAEQASGRQGRAGLNSAQAPRLRRRQHALVAERATDRADRARTDGSTAQDAGGVGRRCATCAARPGAGGAAAIRHPGRVGCAARPSGKRALHLITPSHPCRSPPPAPPGNSTCLPSVLTGASGAVPAPPRHPGRTCGGIPQ